VNRHEHCRDEKQVAAFEAIGNQPDDERCGGNAAEAEPGEV